LEQMIDALTFSPAIPDRRTLQSRQLDRRQPIARRHLTRRKQSETPSTDRRLDELTVEIRTGEHSGYDAADVLRRSTDGWMTPFQIPVWRRAWNQNLNATDDTRPITVILRLSGRTVAVLPLAILENHGLRMLSWHASDLSDYGAPIVCHDQIETFSSIDGAALLRRIARDVGGIDLIYLPKQPLLVGGSDNPLVLPGSTEHHAGAHAINFAAGETFADFLARKRSASTRQQLRKKQRNLEKLGKVGFRLATSAHEARQFAEHCLAAKSKQLAKLGHYDPFASPIVRNFLHDFFAAGIGTTTWAVALTLDDEPLATSIGFALDREWLLYQMAMDGDHASHCSPGTQLLMKIMEHCITKGIDRLDLALGDESYKFEWCDEHQRLVTSTLPLTFKGRIANSGIKLKANVQRKMADNPRLYEAGKSVKRYLSNLGIPV
jgi:CelD/BcsL family acetyltransferase involved in cellulose biosynthesis